MLTPLPNAFVEACSDQFGANFLSQDKDICATYGTDWTRVFKPNPQAVVFPQTTATVASFLRLCNSHSVAVVPSGGRTGLAGGAVAQHGEVVLSLERMRRMDPVDTIARTVRVQAGAITKAVHEHCAGSKLTWPVDFASAGSSQIGGNIATNAGGVRVVRYGLTRQWVLGLQVVTMAGEVLELNGELEKNNTGLDLRQLFIGTEGTLGIITEATLKLTRLPADTRVALLAVDGIGGALRLFESARSFAGLELLAFEYLTHACLQVVLAEKGSSQPLACNAAAYVLVELELAEKNANHIEAWFETIFENQLVSDGVLAQSSKESAELWSLREGISEGLTRKGFLHKNDVALPVRRLESFLEDMHATFDLAYPHYEIYVFGHIGDGNLHINIMKPAQQSREDFLDTCHHTDELLFDIIRNHAGSISAEHGIGLLKRDFLHYTRSTSELAILKQIKQVLDPKGLLNPGKIFTSPLEL